MVFFKVTNFICYEGMAFKSVALGCSKDYGVSWVEKGRIITVGDKPVQPTWSGTGDQGNQFNHLGQKLEIR